MPALSSSRQGERREQRRRDILAVAGRLFAETGYENVTLRAIAEELGYTHATLYRYFPDKSHLLAEICRETMGLLIAEVDALAVAATNAEERLFQVSRRVAHFGRTHPQHFRAVFFSAENRDGRRAADYINDMGSPLFHRLETIFLAALQSGDVRPPDPALAEHTWWSTVFGITLVQVIQGQLPHLPPDESVVEHSLAVMWAGLRAASLPQK